MKTIKQGFYRLCRSGEEEYAVETCGEHVWVVGDEPIDYYIHKGKTWCVTLASCGQLVGSGYKTRKDAMDDMERIDGLVRQVLARDPQAADGKRLARAKRVTAEEFRKIKEEE